MQIAKTLAVCPAPSCLCVCECLCSRAQWVPPPPSPPPAAMCNLSGAPQHSAPPPTLTASPPPSLQGLILVIDWMDGLLSRHLRLGKMSRKYHFKLPQPPLKQGSRHEEQETIIQWRERGQNQEPIMKIRVDDYFCFIKIHKLATKTPKHTVLNSINAFIA